MNTIKGTVKRISDMNVISDKFRKTEFVITTSGMYQQTIQLQCVNNNCDLLANINVGDYIEASFDLKGREWVNKNNETVVFNTIDVFSIKKENNSEPMKNDSINENGVPDKKQNKLQPMESSGFDIISDPIQEKNTNNLKQNDDDELPF